MAWLTNPKRLTLFISAGVLGIVTWYLVHCYLNYEPSLDDEEEEDEESVDIFRIKNDSDLKDENRNSNAERHADLSELGFDKADGILSKDRAAALLKLVENGNVKVEVLVYAANCAAFHESQVNLLTVGFADRAIEMLEEDSVEVRRKALILLNNLCQNPNVVQFENYVAALFRCILKEPYMDVTITENALKVLTNLSVTDLYHHDFMRYFDTIFEIICLRKDCHLIVLHCWKILVNLSTDLSLLHHILNVNYTPSVVDVDPEVLLRILTFLSNAAEGILTLKLKASCNALQLLNYIVNSEELRGILKKQVVPHTEDKEILRVIRKLLINLDKVTMMYRGHLGSTQYLMEPDSSQYADETMTLTSCDPDDDTVPWSNDSNLPVKYSVDSASEIAACAIERVLNESLESCNQYNNETDGECNHNARSANSNVPDKQISNPSLQNNLPTTENQNDFSEHSSTKQNNPSIAFETAGKDSEVKESSFGNGGHDEKDAVKDTINDIMADPIFAFDDSKDTLNATFTSGGDVSRSDADATLLKNLGNEILPEECADDLSGDAQDNRLQEEEFNDDSETLSQNSVADNLSTASESGSLLSRSSSYSVDSFMSANSFR